MIARNWSGNVHEAQAAAFDRRLLLTGVADYRAKDGCAEARLSRRDADSRAHFLLSSVWRDMAAIRACAGAALEVAMLYPGDDDFGLFPDRHVAHYGVLDLES